MAIHILRVLFFFSYNKRINPEAEIVKFSKMGSSLGNNIIGSYDIGYNLRPMFWRLTEISKNFPQMLKSVYYI